MIQDSLLNTGRIEKLHPLFKKAFDFIRNTDFSQIEDGKIETDNPGLYFTVSSIIGKEKEEARIETHNQFIDIQTPLLGVEQIGWKCGEDLVLIATPYNEEKDITFFVDRPTTYAKIYPGQYAVYFPEDGHAPGIGQGSIRKVVAKIKV
ncbi:YhcH/YjgK/YiaL family protein [Parabacteroides sp. Marseille-P3160]|uniref:YhcH/YjgK/YiaL family protein n=1 Tax=Parabacteroides sp. Marseille-P3160 TaxID=1917887 RepID=UPI0009BA8773|nr:YhcH/YjgK/YiaL family protein [Parabacteroides sp. Marseille-P3160]